jgi:hypothetical protein
MRPEFVEGLSGHLGSVLGNHRLGLRHSNDESRHRIDGD